MRIVDDAGAVVPHDGEAVGEIEVRGPWITGSYYNTEAPEKFHDGWLRTGDVGNIDERNFVQITDRSKDVIKSGGEWISSVELETLLVGHPAVADAAVVGVPDERWAERPLATVVLKPGASATPDELREFLAPKVARWWLPERWAFVDELPKTSVGKLDKKVIRADYAAREVPRGGVEPQHRARPAGQCRIGPVSTASNALPGTVFSSIEIVVVPARIGVAADVPAAAVVGDDHAVRLQRLEDDERFAGESREAERRLEAKPESHRRQILDWCCYRARALRG